MKSNVIKVHIIDDQMYIRKLFQLGFPADRFATEVFQSGHEYMKFINIEQINGVPDFIVKPFDIDSVIKKLEMMKK